MTPVIVYWTCQKKHVHMIVCFKENIVQLGDAEVQEIDKELWPEATTAIMNSIHGKAKRP